jgi:hypothetical protein
MTDSPVPVPAAARPAAPEHAATEVTARGQARAWTLRLFPEGLRLDPSDGDAQPIHVPRGDAADRLDVMDVALARRILVVRKPAKRTFKLEPAAWEAVVRWIGRDTRLRMALRKRVGLGIPWGIALLVMGLPIAGLPGNALNAALGLMILAAAPLARRRPHRALFLVDSVFFGALAVTFADRWLGGGSLLWLAFAALNCWLVWRGIALFREFAGQPRS